MNGPIRPCLPWLRSGLAVLAFVLAAAAPVRAQSTDALPLPPEAAASAPPVPPGRPRVGLVLSGGGARGLAHVGVLKVLERERVPVDLIAGTSMGAIIGGLYASGMDAAELERELSTLDWVGLFANRQPRERLAQRRKEEDFEISPALEAGLSRSTGELMLPLASVSSRGLELLLRRYTLPVRQVRRFDELRVPFRAVATDMETGEAVVFGAGDLSQALRASMSVPGVFPPTEVDNRIMGDGGLVNNLPVDVVRAMGADIVIAVNIGTPLGARDSLGTVLGLTSQMINILTEQNVQRSIASLQPGRDVLIAPALGRLTSGDFEKAAELMRLGEQQALALLPRLAALSLSPEQWAAWRQSRPQVATAPVPDIVSVRFEGSDETRPEHFAGVLTSQPGQPFRVAAAEQDSRILAATGDYLHTDYRLEDLPAGTGLVFQLEEKPWGPNYFRLGLDLVSDFAGRGDFNIKLSHNRHWLDDNGSEWRNRVQIGSVPRWFSEWYRPLGPQRSRASDWFVSVHGDAERRRQTAYAPLAAGEDGGQAVVQGRYVRGLVRLGVDVGQPLGVIGEWRLGLLRDGLRYTPEFIAGTDVSAEALSPRDVEESSLRLALMLDTLDHVSFPRAGWRLKMVAQAGRRRGLGTLVAGGREDFQRYEIDATHVVSLGRQTVDATVKLREAHQTLAGGLGHYTLGGFHNLSGYRADQLSGNQVLLGRLTYTLRLNQQPVLTRGFFAGATLEAGNAWSSSGSALRVNDLRWGGSLFLGADTGLGPLYFGFTWAPLGSGGVYLLLGRP
ncbi:NTE family protein [Sphaerotilus hippei]|uniref:NTE family protein n=1 Tax=Sphaerotilus hippei TaxID=744406 RepID=A0A318GXC4_9BURK|nr:patatin-like phospholipase family protein [Sphaerotilus hippei]PXW92772.1 NTE family protein [Sphaerotilus hippei]